MIMASSDARCVDGDSMEGLRVPVRRLDRRADLLLIRIQPGPKRACSPRAVSVLCPCSAFIDACAAAGVMIDLCGGPAQARRPPVTTNTLSLICINQSPVKQLVRSLRVRVAFENRLAGEKAESAPRPNAA